jgi:hypothetical protein
LSPTALRVGYPVHPPVGPTTGKPRFGVKSHPWLPPAKIASTSTTRPTNVTQNESMLSTGKAMSSAPIWIGRK